MERELQNNGISLETCAEHVTEVFLCALFLVMPLAVHRGYFNIVESKLSVFLALSGMYVFVMAVLWTASVAHGKKLGGARISPVELLFLLFIASGILGSLLGWSGIGEMIAKYNRYQGIMMFLLYGVLLVLVSWVTEK